MRIFRGVLISGKKDGTTRRKNASILSQLPTSEDDRLLRRVPRNCLRFFGHIARRRGMEYTILTGKRSGRCIPGRPPTRFVDQLKEFTGLTVVEMVLCVVSQYGLNFPNELPITGSHIPSSARASDNLQRMELEKIGEQLIGQSKAIAQGLSLERFTPGYRGMRGTHSETYKNEAMWWTQSKRCCLKRLDCCLPPRPVYFLEDSGKFYELLSPVLRPLSFTVLQLVSLCRLIENDNKNKELGAVAQLRFDRVKYERENGERSQWREIVLLEVSEN
ncbi:hypothetical protein LAZ67_17000664 [Cordylochernes scorpioides]|uniref:Uncharacterized protein n=1 Tax=Cordylochernes scorpioides TaxID=51811 RepID=A0ABY6LE92_9ARAC|nr:hypothetical protein LAZ67_17000664 [Cordylochernes scorpioides]